MAQTPRPVGSRRRKPSGEGGLSTRFGIHVQVGQGLTKAADAAHELGCETIQLFSGNPRGWKNPAVPQEKGLEFSAATRRLGIEPVVVHATYLINLASPGDEVYEKSIVALAELLERADALGAKYVVLHPGSHLGHGFEAGVQRIGQALRSVLEGCPPGVRILLENVAGGGSTIGSSLEELASVRDAVGGAGERLGLCLDTCHAWAAGIDLSGSSGWSDWRAGLERLWGIESLTVIHANDAMGERGSHLDRHTHIGHGKVGLSGFRAMLKTLSDRDLAVILETPKDSDDADRINLGELKSLWHAVRAERG